MSESIVNNIPVVSTNSGNATQYIPKKYIISHNESESFKKIIQILDIDFKFVVEDFKLIKEKFMNENNLDLKIKEFNNFLKKF